MRLLIVDYGYSFPPDRNLSCGVFSTRLAAIAVSLGYQVHMLTTWVASGSLWLRAIRRRKDVLGRRSWIHGEISFHYHGVIGPPQCTGLREVVVRRWTARDLHQWLRKHGDPCIAHVHWGLTGQAQAAMQVLSDRGVPTVLTEHSSRFFRYGSDDTDIFGRYRLSAARVSTVTAVSEVLADLIRRRTGLRQVGVLPNAIDPVFEPGNAASGSDRLKAIIVGTKAYKGVDIALAGVRQACETVGRTIEVLVVGPYAPADQRAVFACPLMELSIVPQLSTQVLADAYRDSDVYICASEYETFGCAPVEAAMCGTAVVSTKVGVMGDLLRDGCGIEVARTSEAIADAIVRIYRELDSWRARRHEIAAACRTRFGADAVAHRLDAVYRDLRP